LIEMQGTPTSTAGLPTIWLQQSIDDAQFRVVSFSGMHVLPHVPPWNWSGLVGL
jgi:hypothetical protein